MKKQKKKLGLTLIALLSLSLFTTTANEVFAKSNDEVTTNFKVNNETTIKGIYENKTIVPYQLPDRGPAVSNADLYDRFYDPTFHAGGGSHGKIKHSKTHRHSHPKH
ncbi:MAG: hypothetical protein ACI4T3_02295 [Lactobacillus sp.]